MQRRLFRAAMATTLVFFALAHVTAAASKRDSRPNIVFILVDDQDFHMGSMDHMGILQSQLIQQGTLFTKHYGHVSQCCPARATLWTGKHAHNTNVTSVLNGRPGGAWKQIQAKGWYKKYLPVWMQHAGYQTYYAGKIFNGYGTKSYCDPVCLEGWTKADILVDPRTYSYYNSSYAHYDGNEWTIHNRIPTYSTDLIAENVTNFIEEAVRSDSPFFAVAAPVAPHISIGATYPNNNTKLPYPLPKKEYADLFQDLQLPKSPNFNPDNRTGVNMIWGLEQLDEGNVGVLEELYRMRQRALKSVDDLVETLIKKLDNTGVLDNTFIFYTSDNGYHLGNHRLQGGKLQCFEEDINIPLIIRGPGIGRNMTSDLVTGHIDVAPTLLTIAGADLDPAWELDGTALSFPMENELDFIRNLQLRGETSHLEFWGPFQQEGMFGHVDVNWHKNLNIYKALRVQGRGYNLMYSVWCQNGAHELYDMSWDPYQVTNLHPDAPAEAGSLNAYNRGMNTTLGRPIEQVLQRLDALVLVQKTCVADVCREPWKQLHPDGSVTTLAHALYEDHDHFYTRSYGLAKVGWKECYSGLEDGNSSTLYSLANEEPIWLNQTVVRIVRSAAERSTICSRWAWLLTWLGLLSIMGY